MSKSTESTDDSTSVQVTQAAAEQAIKLMQNEDLDIDQSGLRLYVQQGGCAGLSYGLRFDCEPEEDDTVLEQYDLRIFIDPASINYLSGSVLDYEDGLQGAGFTFENPNIVSECGCGESFRT